jgi:hypothetical protein
MVSKTTRTPAKAPAPDIDKDWLRYLLDRDDKFWTKITNRDAVMHERVLGLVAKIVDANSVDNVLAAGLHEIADQLEVQLSPLRTIPNSHVALKDPEDARLTALNLALQRPDFSIPGTTEVGPLLGAPAGDDLETGSYQS